MVRSVLVLSVLAAACGGKKGSSSAHEVRIAAASDLARAFEEVGPAFEKATGIHVVLTPGSTGLLAKQLEEGAPYDLFAAANVKFVDEVVKSGACDGTTQAMYARGRLVVWSRGDGAPAKLEDLADPKYKKIGIANPDHAPYGTAAKQALQKAGVWDAIKDRVVLGENVQVTMQWAKMGEVDASVVALSLAVVADGGSSIPVDPTLHDPLDQAMVVCGTGPGTEAAKKFQAFIGSAEGREIMTRYGFLLPGETAPETKGGTGGDRTGSGAAPRTSLDAVDVRAFLDAWVLDQNNDDLAAYEARYAEKFAGIKRAGPRTRKYDRKGWLADRGKMFQAKAPMTVEIADVVITPIARTAVVRLTQQFAQGKFKDSGDKQLVIVDDHGALKIVREEMLASTLTDDASKARDVPAHSIVQNDAGTWLVLDDEPVDTNGEPSTGGPSKDGWAFSYSTITALAAPSTLVGKPVTVYPSGATCTISRVVELGMLTPHFGTVYEWRGDTDGDGTVDAAPLTEAEINDYVSGGSSYTAADITGCGDGVLGVIDRAATPWADHDGDLDDQARAAFVALDEYKEIQDEFVGDWSGQGAWDDSEYADHSVEAWVGPAGDALVVVGAKAGSGCGDFTNSLYAVYTSKAGGKPKLLSLMSGMPSVAVDTDGDGVPELADASTIYVRDGDDYTELSTVDYGFADCGC